MTLILLVAAAALIVVGGAASAYAAVERSRALAAVACGAVLVAVAGRETGPGRGDLVLTDTDFAETGLGLAATGTPTLLVLATVMVAKTGLESGAAVVGALAAIAGPALFLDPFRDPACVGHCPSNATALLSLPGLASALHHLGYAVLLGAAALVAIRARGVPAPWLLSVAVVVAWAGAPLDWVACATAVVGLATLGLPVVSTTTRRGRLSTMVERLGATDDPQLLLRRMVPGVVLGYRVDGASAWVDSAGRPLDPAAIEGADFVDVLGPEGPIARVWNPGSPSDVAAWSRSLRGPARLALDNARLDAVRHAEAAEVAASSRRLVAQADQQRRTLERDLHDGAQQHVLTLGLLLSLHEQPQDEDAAARVTLARSRDAISGVLDDLRELAHGIHAASLDQHGGLEHALQLLADRSPVPLEVRATADGPMDPQTRLTTYALVEEVLAGASCPVVVDVARDDGSGARDEKTGGDGWTVTVRLQPAARPKDALAPQIVPFRARDRFRALGGSLSADPADRTGALVLRGWLPLQPPDTHRPSSAGPRSEASPS